MIKNITRPRTPPNINTAVPWMTRLGSFFQTGGINTERLSRFDVVNEKAGAGGRTLLITTHSFVFLIHELTLLTLCGAISVASPQH